MKFYFFLLILFITHTSILAQDSIATHEKLNNKFNEVIESSNRYQEYRVIEIDKINKLKKEVTTTAEDQDIEINNLNKRIEDQVSQIQELNDQMEASKIDIAALEKGQDSMELLGIQLEKSMYNIILWSIIGILTILLISFIYKFKNSNSLTSTAQEQLAQIEEEYENYRRNALEKEQRLNRQLLDAKKANK
ncbi:hypothetical protein [Nonlabens sp. SY33080]|uniref:hypothetical protein n=1 Tax=Nonlabens sp. SY33080 TaxID=2719911 RepID=UPI0014289B07|nr:hypothetical protein [Nonlabens sp. SY33080]